MNADEIARGLSPFRPETVSIQAGRLMLGRLHELLAAGETFALETTLATRHYWRFIQEAREQGYFVSLFFFWLNSPDLAVSRVEARVREGGHNIPEPVIKRRYEGGLRQFFTAYCPAVDSWSLIDNPDGAGQLIATNTTGETVVTNEFLWQRLTATYHV